MKKKYNIWSWKLISGVPTSQFLHGLLSLNTGSFFYILSTFWPNISMECMLNDLLYSFSGCTHQELSNEGQVAYTRNMFQLSEISIMAENARCKNWEVGTPEINIHDQKLYFFNILDSLPHFCQLDSRGDVCKKIKRG